MFFLNFTINSTFKKQLFVNIISNNKLYFDILKEIMENKKTGTTEVVPEL